jgi:hypothetical protein
MTVSYILNVFFALLCLQSLHQCMLLSTGSCTKALITWFFRKNIILSSYLPLLFPLMKIGHQLTGSLIDPPTHIAYLVFSLSSLILLMVCFTHNKYMNSVKGNRAHDKFMITCHALSMIVYCLDCGIFYWELVGVSLFF